MISLVFIVFFLKTLNRKRPTFGGYSTKQEMCLSFITYYPKIDLAGCYSMTPVKEFFEIFGVYEFNSMNMTDVENLFLYNGYVYWKCLTGGINFELMVFNLLYGYLMWGLCLSEMLLIYCQRLFFQISRRAAISMMKTIKKPSKLWKTPKNILLSTKRMLFSKNPFWVSKRCLIFDMQTTKRNGIKWSKQKLINNNQTTYQFIGEWKTKYRM